LEAADADEVREQVAHSSQFCRPGRVEPRPSTTADSALTYLLYLLREVQFAGTILDNPFLASVGLVGSPLEQRLRGLTALRFRRQGDLVDFGWQYKDLIDWASATVLATAPLLTGETE
jgi:hypothetical protein